MEQAIRASSQTNISLRTVSVLALEWLRDHPIRAMFAWLTLMAGLRLVLAINHEGYLGVDGGAYLLGMAQFWGGEPTGTSFERPPLAPGYLLVPFMELIGGSLGFNIYAAVFSFAVFPGFFLLAQKIIGTRYAALATVALSTDFALGEMFVTGVVPLAGFGFLALLLYGMIGLSEEGNWKHRAAVVLSMPMIAMTNQTALGLALVVVPIAWLFLNKKIQLLMVLGAGALVSLSALPWYLDVLPGQSRVSYPGPLVYLNFWWSSQWLQALYAIVVGSSILYLFRSEKLGARRSERIIATLLLVHAVLNVFLSNDEALMNIFYRSSYWISIPFWIGSAIVVREIYDRVDLGSLLRVAALIVFLAVGTYGSIYQFYGQSYYSNLAGIEVLNALDSIPEGDITRIGTNAESRGFYFAALTKKPVAWVQSAWPAASYVKQEEKARCELGWVNDCSGEGWISHWIVDTRETQQVKALFPMAPDPEDAFGDLGKHAPWLEKTFQQNNVEVWTYVDAS